MYHYGHSMPGENTKRQISAIRRHGVLAELRTGPCHATTLPRHFHEELQIILSERRVISYGIKGAMVLSPLASVFVIEPEEPHSGHVHETQHTWGALRTFLIPRTSFDHYLGRPLNGTRLKFESPVLTSPGLMKKLRLMHDVVTKDCDDLASESIVAGSLETLLSLTKSPAPKNHRRRSHEKMRIVRDLLGDNPSMQLSLSDIARSIDLSPCHVLREFQLRYGMSPHAFRTQLRIWKARDLLLLKLPISDVAQLTGFADHAHLTRTFHRVVGVPPSRYQTAISFKTK